MICMSFLFFFLDKLLHSRRDCLAVQYIRRLLCTDNCAGVTWADNAIISKKYCALWKDANSLQWSQEFISMFSWNHLPYSLVTFYNRWLIIIDKILCFQRKHRVCGFTVVLHICLPHLGCDRTMFGLRYECKREIEAPALLLHFEWQAAVRELKLVGFHLSVFSSLCLWTRRVDDQNRALYYSNGAAIHYCLHQLLTFFGLNSELTWYTAMVSL